MGTFCDKAVMAQRVQPIHDLLDKVLVLSHRVKVEGPPQQQGLMQAIFEMTMRAFYRSIFVGYPAVIACRLQLVMLTQPLI